jgi:DNA-binding LytR/AlgR family response regulator
VIRALVVDDEAPARDELRFLLGEHDDVEVVGEAPDAAQALRLAETLRPDAVFLDVEMPGLSGLDAARALDGPRVVFVTAYERYAAQAFAVEAFDYLLKPVDPERLARVVERLRTDERALSAAVARVPVVAAGKTVLLDPDTIHYARADGDYARIHTYDRAYLCTMSLRELEETLSASRFVRIHRSTLVNLSKVATIAPATGDRLRLGIDDAARTQLEVSRRQTRSVRERLRL